MKYIVIIVTALMPFMAFSQKPIPAGSEVSTDVQIEVPERTIPEEPTYECPGANPQTEDTRDFSSQIKKYSSRYVNDYIKVQVEAEAINIVREKTGIPVNHSDVRRIKNLINRIRR